MNELEEIKKANIEIWSDDLESKIIYMLNNGCTSCYNGGMYGGIQYPDRVSMSSIYYINSLDMESVKNSIEDLIK